MGHPDNNANQVDSEIKDMGFLYMIKEKDINNHKLFAIGVDKFL